MFHTVSVTVGLLLLCVAACATGSTHQNRELYVSTPNQQCPQDYNCSILLDYLQNVSATFTSNTTIHFLPGNHSAVLPQPTTLVVYDVTNLVLTGPKMNKNDSLPQIKCNFITQFHFRNTTNVTFRNLWFMQCGVIDQQTFKRSTVSTPIPSFQPTSSAPIQWSIFVSYGECTCN